MSSSNLVAASAAVERPTLDRARRIHDGRFLFVLKASGGDEAIDKARSAEDTNLGGCYVRSLSEKDKPNTIRLRAKIDSALVSQVELYPGH